jgi:glycosyltransferase involved in cell wall biosynthesis
MSAGLTTLVPDNPSVRASIVDGETGLVYEENSVVSACEALERAIYNKKLREKLSLSAQKVVREEFNLNDTNNALQAIMKKLYFK